MTKDQARQLANDALQDAIQTMRDACDSAEESMRLAIAGNLNPAMSVCSRLRWGFLNALAGIETAQSYLDEGKPE